MGGEKGVKNKITPITKQRFKAFFSIWWEGKKMGRNRNTETIVKHN